MKRGRLTLLFLATLTAVALAQYPAGIYDADSPATRADSTWTQAENNAHQAETEAIQTELGTHPSGASTTVRERLEAIETAIPTPQPTPTPQPAYATIEDEATPLPQQSSLNFEGAGVACADGTGKTTCTVSTSAGGGAMVFSMSSGSQNLPTTGTRYASITGVSALNIGSMSSVQTLVSKGTFTELSCFTLSTLTASDTVDVCLLNGGSVCQGSTCQITSASQSCFVEESLWVVAGNANYTALKIVTSGLDAGGQIACATTFEEGD